MAWHVSSVLEKHWPISLYWLSDIWCYCLTRVWDLPRCFSQVFKKKTHTHFSVFLRDQQVRFKRDQCLSVRYLSRSVHEARLVKSVPFSEATHWAKRNGSRMSSFPHHPVPPGIHLSPLAPSAHVTPTMLLSITAAILVNTHSVAAHAANPVSLSGGCAERDWERERDSCDCCPTTELFSISSLLTRKQSLLYATDFLLIPSGGDEGDFFFFLSWKKKKKRRRSSHTRNSTLFSPAGCCFPFTGSFLSLCFLFLQGLLVGGCVHSCLISILRCIWTLGRQRPSLLLLLLS